MGVRVWDARGCDCELLDVCDDPVICFMIFLNFLRW